MATLPNVRSASAASYFGGVYCLFMALPSEADFLDGARVNARGDYATARDAFLEAAQNGNVEAQNNLGVMLRHGKRGRAQVGWGC
jgi:TPR repeat protein